MLGKPIPVVFRAAALATNLYGLQLWICTGARRGNV